MPIRPENRGRYPMDWPAISRHIRHERALGRCECNGECGRDGWHLETDGRARPATWPTTASTTPRPAQPPRPPPWPPHTTASSTWRRHDLSPACGVTGTAVVTQHDNGSLTWQQADPEIHVAAELLAEPMARAHVETMYAVADWCNDAKAYHARRKASS